ncbi:MAG: FHA domain-containing protein [Phycisphaeraceae bacterium]|nr:FHA domain-containing protein [Phycisphaeraceae bacterium]
MQQIQIRHLARSTLAGQERTFDTQRIRLGRRAENDIVFDAVRDALVSGSHVEIHLDNGQLLVTDLGSSNGTFVNGRRISAPTPVQPSDVISLGQGGPEFSVSVPGAVAPAPAGVSATIVAPVRPKPVQAVPSVRPYVAPKAAPPAVAPGRDMQPVARAGGPAHPEAPHAHKGVGMNTLMRVVKSATAKERKRTTMVATVIAALLAVGVGLGVYFSIPKASETPTGPSLPSAREIQNRILGSTYVVMVRHAGQQRFSPQGTAWSVRPGLLATNAHVAELFTEVGTGGEVIARKHCAPGEEPTEVRITGITMHPGYERFQELIREYNPFSPSASRFFSDLITPYDVALLIIHEEDRAKQAPPIPLVPANEVTKIEPGMTMHSAGFPLEGYALQDWTRPTASAFSSQVSRLNDEFFASASPADANMMMYQFAAVGGQSGSSVVDERGRVIGFVSAINAVAAVAGRDEKGGTCYGPRVDILHELLDGTAEARQAERDKTLRNRFAEAFLTGISDPSDICEYLLPRVMRAYERPQGTQRWAVAAATTDIVGKVNRGQTWRSQSLRRGGLIAVYVVAKDHRGHLGGTVTLANTTFGNSNSTDMVWVTPYFGATDFTMPNRDNLTISVRLANDAPIGEVEFTVLIYHLVAE